MGLIKVFYIKHGEMVETVENYIVGADKNTREALSKVITDGFGWTVFDLRLNNKDVLIPYELPEKFGDNVIEVRCSPPR